MASSIISCRWDWCRSTFSTIDALDTHVKHVHIWSMKPMRKSEITLMRKMDLQSLHSSQNADSSIAATPDIPKHPGANEFDAFATLPRNNFLQGLPVPPTSEGSRKQDGLVGIPTTVETSNGQPYSPKQWLRLPSPQYSPSHRSLSRSSNSSQEVVELQLTQEDARGLLLSDLPAESDVDPELRWPTDDELEMHAAEEIRTSEQPLSKQNDSSPGSSFESVRGQAFHYGSLNVPFRINGTAPTSSSQYHGSSDPSQLLVLQTQAPYSSQTTGWSETSQ